MEFRWTSFVDTVDFKHVDPETFPILLELDFVNAYLTDFPAVDKCVCPFLRRRVAAPFGRARREGSEEEDVDNAGYVDFNCVEDTHLKITTCRPRTACSVPVGRGPETPVKGDRSTAASLRDLYPWS